MAKTVTFEIDTDLCELTVDSGTLFLGEQAPIVFAGYTPASGNTLFLSLFDKDHVTPLADNATSANTLDLRYDAMRDAFGDCKAAHSFYATVIERTSGGSWVGHVLAAGHVRVEWSPVVFDAVSGNPATLKGATGATGAALTWDMLTDAQKASLKGADGANGATGATGPQGPQGPQGIQGIAGPQGAAGTNGTNGSDGADGVSPVVSVTDVIGGHKVTIVDASGTKEFTVLNGSTGAQGPQGVQGVQGLPGIKGEKGDTGDPSHALEGVRMRNSPSQRQMILALKKVWTALGGTIVCLMLSLSCFAVNRDTEWQDVPPETRVGTVLDLGGGGGVSTNAVSGIITNHVTSGYLCTVAAANEKLAEAKSYTQELTSERAKLISDGNYKKFEGLESPLSIGYGLTVHDSWLTVENWQIRASNETLDEHIDEKIVNATNATLAAAITNTTIRLSEYAKLTDGGTQKQIDNLTVPLLFSYGVKIYNSWLEVQDFQIKDALSGRSLKSYLNSLEWRTAEYNTLASYGIANAYTKSAADARFAPTNVAVAVAEKIDAAGALGVFNANADYLLVNLADNATAATLASGTIANLETTDNALNVTLSLSANDRSADAMLRIVNTQDVSLGIGNQGVALDGSWPSTIKAGTNLVMFCKTAYKNNTAVITVTSKEIK